MFGLLYCGYSHIPEVTVFPTDGFRVGAIGKPVEMIPFPDDSNTVCI